MKTVLKITLATLMLCLMAAASFAADSPVDMHVSCDAPNPNKQGDLRRPKGDSDIWQFNVVLDGDAHFVSGPVWHYPGKGGNDPDWGLWTGGANGDSSLSWSSPGKTGSFGVTADGKISCDDGSGGGEGKDTSIDFSVGWSGKVEFNAEIKVKRKSSGDSYSSSANVAEGGLGSDEHKADVVVVATDDDDNPLEGLSVPTPSIQDNFGEKKFGSVSAVDATTDADGKAYFTFTSGDQRGSLTLKVDGAENDPTASIEQQWANGNGSFPDCPDCNDTSFTYETPAQILFKMTLAGSTPITRHDIHFVPTAISGYDWDAEEVKDYSVDTGGIPQAYLSLINCVSKQESPTGSYPGTVTVKDDVEFTIISVTIKAVDYNAYQP